MLYTSKEVKCADNKLPVDQKMVGSVFERAKKRTKSWLPAFSPLHQMLSKLFLLNVV